MKSAGPLRSLGCALLAAAIVACGNDLPSPSGTPSTDAERLVVQISPDEDSLHIGSTRLFSAEVVNASSTQPAAPIVWSSTNTDIVTIGADGMATAVSAGSAQLVATTTGAADTAAIVVFGEEATLQITPGAASMFMGDAVRFHATGPDSARSSGRVLTWSSSDTNVATVSADGVVTASGTGDAVISATDGTASARAPVEVHSAAIASLTITPATSSVIIGDSATLAVSAVTTSGRAIPRNGDMQWTTTDTTIATVDGNGRVQARAIGYATVEAHLGELRTTATVQVVHAPASAIALAARDTVMLKGESIALKASVKDASGAIINAPALSWKSTDAKVAAVDAAGNVMALAPGKATISAESGNAFAKLLVTVARRLPTAMQILPAAPTLLAGRTAQLSGRIVDQHGKALAGYPITWSVSDAEVASVTAYGMITGIAPGAASIIATSGSFRKTVRAIVSGVAISDFKVSPSSVTLVRGGSLELHTSSADAAGNPLADRIVAWSSSNPAVATVDEAGITTAVAPGSAEISATAEGRTATAEVMVRPATPATVAAIDIKTNSGALAVGQSTKAVATLRSASGEVLEEAPVTWKSRDPSIATVTSDGMITAVHSGSASITAASGTATASVTVVVNGVTTAAVTSVTVALSPAQVATGKTSQATVTIRNASGAIVTGRTVTWTTTQNSVATVSSSGLVTGVSAGEAGIKATVEGVTGKAWLRVVTGTAGPVSKVTVTAPGTSMYVGGKMTAVANLYDAGGAKVTAPVTWTSSQPAVARVGAAGVVTALAAGTTTIKATSGSIFGSLGITVTSAAPAPVASISLSLTSSSLAVGQTSQVTAVARDALSRILPGLTFIYTSSNTAVATVSSSGLVKALKTGTATISATSGGKVGSATMTVGSATPPPSAPLPPGGAAAALAMIGPTISPSGATALGGAYARYDALWARWEPVRFGIEGTSWSGNYYDRAQIYYAQWIRTGNNAYKTRGDAMAVDYRRNYLKANNYNTSAHWSQLDGVALHYWLTGDDSSRMAVGRAARTLVPTLTWARNGQWTDARQQARALIGTLLAWQLNAPAAPSGGWAKALDDGLNVILPQQSADGGWRYPVNTCNVSLNYMNAMLADALIRVYTEYRPDSRIPGAVKKTADFLWTQWRSRDLIPSFNYYEANCSNQHGSGGPTATADLTGLFVTTYAWMASRDQAYRPKSDAVFTATMNGMYPLGSKQFNQAFAFGWRALGYVK